MTSRHTVLLDESELCAGIERLAERISLDYAGKEFILLSVTNGAIVFTADLLRRITGKVRLETVRASSYKGTASGTLTVRDWSGLDFTGKHIIIVDDILDSGQTLSVLRDTLQQESPASVRICVLLDKPTGRTNDFQADYTGFTVPGKYVYGFGLDDAHGLNRNLPFIAIGNI